MGITFFILSMLALLYGGFILGVATSALHEIEAYIFFLIASVFLSTAGIMSVFGWLEERMRAGIDDAVAKLKNGTSNNAN